MEGCLPSTEKEEFIVYPNPDLDPICADNCGTMPTCAPLAVPYVPYQQTSPNRYAQMDALSNGTLYPGLNLPFKLNVNATCVEQTPMHELQALEFVIQELSLYLDTHPGDQEAFSLFCQYTALEQTARADYAAKYGPLYKEDTAMCDSYLWNRQQFPWNNHMEG